VSFYSSSELSKLQIRMFMDYCYLIEKLWFEWKEYCLHFFTLSERHYQIPDS
jgi:hypothetical protein